MTMESLIDARRPFVGVWNLASFTEHAGSAGVFIPLGMGAVGFLIYTADGFVSAQLMRRDRKAFGANPWAANQSGDRADLTKDYIAYCGRYEVDVEKAEVVHFPIVALVPNLIDQKQRRSFTFKDKTLTLVIMQNDPDGGVIESRLVWTRDPNEMTTS